MMLKANQPTRRGSASMMSIVLLVVLLALGVIVGAVALRDHLVQEFGDAAVALDHLDQSWSYVISIDQDGDGNVDHQCMAGYTDPAPTLMDPGTPGMPQPPAGITFVTPSSTESPVPEPAGTIP